MTRHSDALAGVWKDQTLPQLEAHLRSLREIGLRPTTAFTGALRRRRAEADQAFAATRIRLANESALGVYRFTWTSPAEGARCAIYWAEGMDKPSAEFNGVLRPVIRPERFGWPPPAERITAREMAAFARRYATDLEAALTAPDDGGR